MIFDRTISDVRNAQQIRKDKVQKGIALTEVEKSTLERGTLSYNTLNRIELKQAELASVLTEMGYPVSIINKQWSAEQLFTESEFVRIARNNAKLRKSFFVYSNTPMDAVARYRYDEINALERILYDLEIMTEYTKSKYRRCGAYNCGEG